ncbi:glutaredoxin domain-containing protein [Gordonia rhizosphera]|uniref:glutaredoxin domain-containing protein n=1 Tax=Gordonia rhizosphera TaxID=83341 RepID=UPI003570DA48
MLWRPGCLFCARLRRGLRRRDIPTTESNIWDDESAAARVRNVTGGDETVPTVFVGSVAMVNPSVRQSSPRSNPSFPIAHTSSSASGKTPRDSRGGRDCDHAARTQRGSSCWALCPPPPRSRGERDRVSRVSGPRVNPHPLVNNCPARPGPTDVAVASACRSIGVSVTACTRVPLTAPETRRGSRGRSSHVRLGVGRRLHRGRERRARTAVRLVVQWERPAR